MWKLLAIALMAMLAAPARTGAACADTAGDQASIALARVAIEQACPCAATADARTYRKCAAGVIVARVQAGALAPGCASSVRRCVRASVCGRPGAVSCCSSGGSRCRVRRSAAACVARGGTPSACASCCETCAPGCGSATTTTTLPPACGESAPQCNGGCPGGSQCQDTGLGACACLPDGTTGCGATPFPTCDGGCEPGRSCQAIRLSGEVDLAGCICVPDTARCGPPASACTAPGRCAEGSVCGAFVAGGTLECGCFAAVTSTTTTTPGPTTTTTIAPGTPCDESPYPACGGECAAGALCQPVHAVSQTVSFDVTLCQCVQAQSTCQHFLGGSCPGACPAGQACLVFSAGGGPPECSCTAL